MQAAIDDEGLRGVVARATEGDEIAFARIVAEHHDDMARVSFVVCGDIELAQDAVQAAWPKAWRKLGSIRDPGRLRPWLLSIAANEARQLLRARSRRWLREVPIADDTTESLRVGRSDPAAHAGEVDLANALSTLDPGDRMLVGLRYAAGLTSDEIGLAIGMTGGGVRARMARILVRLRKELQDD
jgi:RNA polymerase sigma factor (sigma-70 family)